MIARNWTSSRNSLAWRLTAWFGGGTLLVVAAAAIVLSISLEAQTRWVDDQVLLRRSGDLSELLKSPEAFSLWIGHEVSEDMDGPRKILIRVIGADGAVLAETPGMDEILPAGLFADVSSVPLEANLRMDRAGRNGDAYRALSARYPSVEGVGGAFATVQMATDTRLDAIVLERYRTIAVMVTVLLLLACIATSAMAVSRALAPIRRFADAVDVVGSNTLDRRLQLAGLPEELAHLGRQFNAMLVRIEESYGKLQHYADDVAHEIRTPLNAMLLNAEVSLLTETTVEGYRRSLERTMEDCQRLMALAGRLLFLARADGGVSTPILERVNVAEEIGVITRYFEASAEDAGVALEVDVPIDCQIKVDRVLFQRAVSNLVANAIAHTKPGGRVIISAANDGVWDSVMVRDTGVGIPAEFLVDVFDRYNRGSQAAAGTGPEGQRVGLGLAITKAILEMHSGSVRLESVLGEGTTATLQFPRGASASV